MDELSLGYMMVGATMVFTVALPFLLTVFDGKDLVETDNIWTLAAFITAYTNIMILLAMLRTSNQTMIYFYIGEAYAALLFFPFLAAYEATYRIRKRRVKNGE